MKKELRQIIALVIIELIILFPITLVDAITISSVRTEDITKTTATVKWSTSDSSNSLVNYGTSTSLGSQRSAPALVKNHSVQLINLAKDTLHYYNVVSTNNTDTATDNNNGNLYSFTTLPETTLFVNASIPSEYHEGHQINVEGESIRLATINLYVNNEAPRNLRADMDGSFIFPYVNLIEGANIIRLTAESLGQVVEKIYNVTVDTIPPTVILKEIPSIVGTDELEVSGNASEDVTIYFYVTAGGEDTNPPPKVTGLRNTTVQANMVEFGWNKINVSDFGKYIVYRNDMAIALIGNMNYNEYTDVLVNTNTTYTYKVSAMDTRGNEGEKSDLLTIRTLPGGLSGRPEPQIVDIHEDISGLVETIRTNKTFNVSLRLGRNDGFYNIKIEAKDKGGNTWAFNQEILLDTNPPEIDIISPRTNAEIYESYADRVTITGRTEPGARVYLYIQRTPFGLFNISVDVSGFPTEIQNIPEADLRADCNLAVLGTEYCGTHADYETVADSEGMFEFSDIDLTSMFAGAFSITEIPTGVSYNEYLRQQTTALSRDARLLFIATDVAGRRGIEDARYRIANCWEGNFTWNAIPLVEYQSPSFLSVERLKEGTEAIYFYFNFTYHGSAADARVRSAYIQSACGQGYLENQKEFNYSCRIMPRGCTEKLNPSGRTVYVACPLGRLEGIEQWSDKQWENFIDAVHNEMIFPFRVRIDYEETANNRQQQNSQTFCESVSYVVDATRINPKDVLPDWLLYDAVEFLNKTIKVMNDWITTIRQILQWTAIACMATFFVKFVTQIYRRISCHYDRFYKMVEGKLQKISGDNNKEQEDKCKQCINQYERNREDITPEKIIQKMGNGENIQDYLSDTCLKECYPSCSSAWGAEASLYTTYRWSCDRTFGHKTPSKWTEKVSDEDIYQKLSEGSGCANDQSVRGRPLRALPCRSFENQYPTIRGRYGMDDKCVEITTSDNLGGSRSLYRIDRSSLQGENVYTISFDAGDVPRSEYQYVIKQNEDNYLAPMQDTCQKVCTDEQRSTSPSLGLTTQEGARVSHPGEGIGRPINTVVLPPPEAGRRPAPTTTTPANEPRSIAAYGCEIANKCISYTTGERRFTVEGRQQPVDVKTAIPMGYTSDCFSPATASNDADKRVECCCINGDTSAFPEYYAPGDVESKDGTFGANGYENMKWSYRYDKTNYKNKEYNENRYIDGRDYPACFGQNNWIYDGFSSPGEVGNLLIIDPAKQHTSAFQCLSISGILNRLVLIKNIMTSIQNCLLTIRTTGRADSGVCKELFTQFVCSFIWTIITWIRDGCLPFGSGVDLTKSENSVLEAVSVGMKGVWDSVEDSQQELASEYGNAKLTNLLGEGQEGVFRQVCLAAFGYDWEVNAESLFDAAYSSPYATLVQAIGQGREYLTFDPTTSQSKYEYRSSWLVNPGCDLEDYDVYLTCVTRDEMMKHSEINCQKVKDPWGKNCDCIDLPADKGLPQQRFFDGKRLAQNQLEDTDHHEVITSPYRYDHLRFELRLDRDIVKSGEPGSCFPNGHEDGIFYFPITDYTAREIAGCSVNMDGTFRCGQGASFFYEQGNAYFEQIMLEPGMTVDPQNIQGVHYYAETPDTIRGEVNYYKDQNDQCMVVRLLDKNRNIVPGKQSVVDLRRRNAGSDRATFNTGYNIRREDAGTSFGDFIVTYTNPTTGLQRRDLLIYDEPDKTNMITGTENIQFIDADGNGITFSGSSRDRYKLADNIEVEINTLECQGNGCYIPLPRLGIRLKVLRVISPPEQANVYNFNIQAIRTSTTTGSSSQPAYYLHLDLRHPRTADSGCSGIDGPEFDDSMVIVANNARQSIDIPIYVLPGARSVDKCDARYETEEIRVANQYGQLEKRLNVCVCGTGTTKNCPTASYDYCYGWCRQYPRCDLNAPITSPCVCDNTTAATQPDCPRNAPPGQWYCVQATTRYSCSQTPQAPAQSIGGTTGLPTTTVDTTPLQVTMTNPTVTPEQNIRVGATLYVTGTIVDDIVSGTETYEILVNGQAVAGSLTTNTPRANTWIVNYPWVVGGAAGDTKTIQIRATDGNLVSHSAAANIRIAAATS